MKKLLTLTAIGSVMLATEAFASGYNLREQSAAAQGNAFAGSAAAAEDITYAIFNPASLTMVKDAQAALGAAYILSTVRANNLKTGDPSLSTEVAKSVISHAVIPSAAYAKRLNDKTVLGISFNVTDGMATDYSDYWAGAYHGTLTSLKTYRLTPMLSYDLTKNLTIAGGPTLQYAEAIMKGYAGAAKGHTRLNGDAFDVGYNVGMMYKFNDQTRAGVSYRSEVRHKMNGDITFAVATPGNQKIRANISSPAVLAMGLYHDINEKWAVMAEVERTFWSCFDELRIRGAKSGILEVVPENWHDSWFYSVGANYKVNDQLKLRFGLGFDQTPVKSQFRTPRIPDGDKYLASVGAEYKLNQNWTINGAYLFTHVRAGGMNLTEKVPVSGKYQGNIHVFGVSAIYNF